ncbi:MAG: LysM peptidoglycan-binding domain-containing protein, partial [Oligoflexia bacterium]|nr:LysM peptidoglycan-binding domain-containing protein [Oligoflexia bacterium]
MEETEYERWIHNIYLQHYKDPISNSDWNERIQNLPKQYQLKFRDTLWDLSGSFFKDSLYWSKIWVINPQVENPHLIYRDDFVKLDPLAISEINKSKLSVDIQDQFPGLVVPDNSFSKKALSEGEIPSSLPNIPMLFRREDEIDLKQLRQDYASETMPIPFYLSDNIPSTYGQIVGKDGYGRFFGVLGEKVILRLEDGVPIGTVFTVFKNNGKIGSLLSNLIGQGDEYEVQVKGTLKVVSYIQGTGSLYKAR